MNHSELALGYRSRTPVYLHKHRATKRIPFRNSTAHRFFLRILRGSEIGQIEIKLQVQLVPVLSFSDAGRCVLKKIYLRS